MQCRELHRESNYDEIFQLFFESFSASENDEEACVVRDLVHRYLSNYPREDLRGFVAIEGDTTIGCVFFSRLDYPLSDKNVFILSPMAVKTIHQGKGVGRTLIEFAHHELRKAGVHVTATYGDVRFYSKAGYEWVSEASMAAPFELAYPEGWLACAIDGITRLAIEGPVQCIPELNDSALW
jgi:putative acetyltransferase